MRNLFDMLEYHKVLLVKPEHTRRMAVKDSCLQHAEQDSK